MRFSRAEVFRRRLLRYANSRKLMTLKLQTDSFRSSSARLIQETANIYYERVH